MILEPWSHPSSAGLTLRGTCTPPSGRPVVHFLHGNGFCGRTYEPLLVLLARDFDLFLSDVQGHGDSDHGGRFHGWHRTAELCTEAWAAHAGRYGDAPIYALGHSFGGVVSALMMARDPGLFRRAVLLDPVLFPPAMMGLMALSDVVGLYSRNTLALRARKRRRHWPDREAAVRTLRGRGMFRGWRDEALQAYAEHALKPAAGGGVELKCAPTLEAQIYGAFPRRLWAALARIENPTRVLFGERTFPFLPQAVGRWCRSRPNVSAVRMCGGHCFMQEDPETSALQIRAFLS
ncbi:MAG: alpha/beta hydrolase [Rhodocyclaceae bacterium]|nr:alpha/beta hydrolase [Rhodocyclaceae bacterium]MCL4758526.1 alpha/beta hydrolase [Rhodocyclaceae bacterium]